MDLTRNELLTLLSAPKPPPETWITFEQDLIKIFNNDLIIAKPFQFEFTGTVCSERLIAVLDRIKKNENISLFIEGQELRLATKRIKIGIPLVDKTTIVPSMELPTDQELWYDFGPEYHKAVSQCMTTAETNSKSKPILSMIHVSTFNRFVEATDNYRISRYKVLPGTTEMGIDFLLPLAMTKTALELSPTHVSVDGGRVFLKNEEEDTIIGFSTIDASAFPNLDQFIDAGDGSQITFPKGIGDALARSEVFITASESKIYCKIKLSESGGAVLETQSTDGWIQEDLRVQYAGKSVTLLVQPASFQEALKISTKALVCQNMLKLTSEEGFIHVIWLPHE